MDGNWSSGEFQDMNKAQTLIDEGTRYFVCACSASASLSLRRRDVDSSEPSDQRQQRFLHPSLAISLASDQTT